MDLRRARIADWLMGGFGVLVIATLFLGWYCAPPPGSEDALGCGPVSVASAWEAFAVVDVVMLVAGLVGVVALIFTLAHDTAAVPLALTAIGALVATVAALLVLFRLVNAPELPGAAGGAEPMLLTGAWLGGAAILALVLAMLASIRDERTPAPSLRAVEANEAMRTLSVSAAGEGGDAARGGARSEGAA
jgi:hypothetical protein